MGMSRNFYTPDLRNPEILYLLKKKQDSKSVQGMVQIQHETAESAMKDSKNRIIGSFKTYQGTERVYEQTTIWEDTAVVTAMWNPNINIRDWVYVPKTGKTYEVITEPEDINLKHKFIIFKVKKVMSNV